MSHLSSSHLSPIHQRLRLIGRHLVQERRPLEGLRMVDPAEPRFDPPPEDAPWRSLEPEETEPATGDRPLAYFGGTDQWTWFRGEAAAPKHWSSGAIELRWRIQPHWLADPRDDQYPAGPEGLVFIEGEIAGGIDREHHAIRWPLKPARTYRISGVWYAGRCPCRHVLEAAELLWVDTAAEKLWYDLRVATAIAEQIPEASPRRRLLIEAVEAALEKLDVTELDSGATVPAQTIRDPEDARFRGSVARAQSAFDAAISEIEPDPHRPSVAAVGHAHLDLAWLWPKQATRHKLVRTAANQLRLTQRSGRAAGASPRFGKWSFAQSSPQMLAWLAEDAPSLFEQVRAAVKAGRWEPVGPMWVEADCNLPSGESLLRQLIHGLRWWEEHLGVRPDVAWLPDSFGFPASLPQLFKLVGVDRFLTSKLSWNRPTRDAPSADSARFPHDTFRWRGIDGSELLTHMLTTPDEHSRSTYRAKMTPEEVKRTWESHRPACPPYSPLMCFGHGDGGGGPTDRMLETARRLAQLPGDSTMPAVRLTTAAGAFDRIAKHAEGLPVWVGELYLQTHRGTFTSQGWLKREHRDNERRLHDVEWLTALTRLFKPLNGLDVDAAGIDELWKTLLQHQFHDILPGTSIGAVYDQVRTEQRQLASAADDRIDHLAREIARRIDLTAYQRPVLAVNTLSWERFEPLQLPDGAWLPARPIPPCGWRLFDAAEASVRKEPVTLTFSNEGRRLTNHWWRIELDEQGRIASLHDRVNDRAVVPEGRPANEWQVFEDRPIDYDAWNIGPDAFDRPLPGPKLTSLTLAERGTERLAVRLTWEMPSVGDGPESTITQDLAIYADHPRIDFETTIDWREHHKLLKVAMPLWVHAHEAGCEIPFGHFHRPTDRNAPHNAACFEVCAHRFVDLSGPDYGVALLNNGRYGHDIHGDVLRLTCLKSAQSPHGAADLGTHRFTYALLPHTGSLQQAQVPRRAMELNTPLILKPIAPAQAEEGLPSVKAERAREADSFLPGEAAPIRCDHPSVVIDTLKPADDGRGIIARIYESHGIYAEAWLTFAHPPTAVAVNDPLERSIGEGTDSGVELVEGKVWLSLRPFQVLTLRIRP